MLPPLITSKLDEKVFTKKEKSMKNTGGLKRRIIACIISAALVIGSTLTVFAFSGGYQPTANASVEDCLLNAKKQDTNYSKNAAAVITASAHAAAAVLPEILGLNGVSGYSITKEYPQSGPSNSEEAKQCGALDTWGGSINLVSNPYYTNYYYNFYAKDNGKIISGNALINGEPAEISSPSMADTNVKEEYGGVSASVYPRPDVLIGAASDPDGTDLDGYNDQIELINGTGKNYSPSFVAYNYDSLNDLIDSAKAAAIAANEIYDETDGKIIARYGDPAIIAGDYEKYVNGLEAYILSKIASGEVNKKTVAIVSDVNDDATVFTIAPSEQTSRISEYYSETAVDLAESLGKTEVTADELMSADMVVACTLDSADLVNLNDALDKYSGSLIENIPDSAGGIVSDSADAAAGFAYFNSFLYGVDLELNPVYYYSYYVEHFYHVANGPHRLNLVSFYMMGCDLPGGRIFDQAGLGSAFHDVIVENAVVTGMAYYEDHKADFTGTRLEGWEVDWETGIGSEPAVVFDKESAELNAGDSTEIIATVTPLGVKTDVVWETSDASVATVNNGVVNAVAQGTAVITATAGSSTAECRITVIQPVTGITISSDTASVNVDASINLTTNVTPSNATDPSVTWESSDTSIAAVSYGKVTGIKPGTATITAKAGDFTASCKVTVIALNISKATVSGVSDKVYTGKNITMSVLVTMNGKALKNGTDYAVSYKNNKNTGKASVVISGEGNYQGTLTKYFNIVPKKVTSVKTVNSASKTVKVSYKKVVGASGYQVLTGTNKAVTKGKKSVTSSKTSAVIKKLKKGKTYYVKVRAYKTIDNKKVYGAWSSAVKVKITR